MPEQEIQLTEEPARIVYVENEPDSRIAIEVWLNSIKKPHVIIHTFHSSQELWDACRKHTEGFNLRQIRILICDLNLTGENGDEVARQVYEALSSDHRDQLLYIITSANKIGEGPVNCLFKRKANQRIPFNFDFVHKPEFINMLTELFQKKRALRPEFSIHF